MSEAGGPFEFRRRAEGEALRAFVNDALHEAKFPKPRIVPPRDLALMVAAFLEAMTDVRDELDRYGAVREGFEHFRRELVTAGFPVGFHSRMARARGQRRLGEIADLRGDTHAAIWHYEQALKSYAAVGCRQKLAALRKRVSP